jgi:hypothetical protein
MQDGQNVSVYLMFTMHHCCDSIWLLGSRPPGPGGIRLTLTPSVIPNCNYLTVYNTKTRKNILIIRCTETFWSPCIATCVSNLDTRWKWVVRITSRLLYRRGIWTLHFEWEAGWIGLNSVRSRKIWFFFPGSNRDTQVTQSVPTSLFLLCFVTWSWSCVRKSCILSGRTTGSSPVGKRAILWSVPCFSNHNTRRGQEIRDMSSHPPIRYHA